MQEKHVYHVDTEQDEVWIDAEEDKLVVRILYDKEQKELVLTFPQELMTEVGFKASEVAKYGAVSTRKPLNIPQQH